VPSIHSIEYEDLRKFGLATNRKLETLPVSNVASYVQALLTLLLNCEKSRQNEVECLLMKHCCTSQSY
jgi:hypothetical protein